MSVDGQMISLSSQISTVEQEIAMRRRVYQRQVAQGKMRQLAADLGISHMQAVLTTLLWLQKHEAKIKAKVEGGQS